MNLPDTAAMTVSGLPKSEFEAKSCTEPEKSVRA